MAYFTGYFDSYFDVAAGSVSSAVGNSTGTATGASTYAAAGSASGSATVSGRTDASYTELGAGGSPRPYVVIESRSADAISSGVGASDGAATADAVGRALIPAAAASDGIATVAATGRATAAAVGSSAGIATVDGIGSSTGVSEGVGSAAGVATVTGIGERIGGTDEQPSGGWLAYNYAQIDRNRRRAEKRRRELEEEADRLEMALAAEGLVTPSPEVVARHTVREYAPQVADFSRRAQRAVAYAEKAQTAAAYQMALRQIQRELEDEETAVAMLLALVA